MNARKKPSDYPRDRRAFSGALRVDLAKLISNGVRSQREILRILSRRGYSYSVVLSALHTMSSDALVMRTRGGLFSLTTTGWALAPRPLTLVEITGTYIQPVAPPRRPGSDHSHILSIAGGQRLEYVPHV